MEAQLKLEKEKNVRAFGWDPTRPTAVMIPTVGADGEPVVHSVHAGAGTGCHPHEYAALVQLVQAHEQFQSAHQTARIISTTSVKGLFSQYRQAVSECIEQWDDSLQAPDGSETNEETKTEKETENAHMPLYLLKINYAVLHISDIFLPLLPSSKLQSSPSAGISSFLTLRDPYSVPGLTTAEMVRYLRYNHLTDLANDYGTEYEEMMKARQPERFAGDLYWTAVSQLVLRGCLEEAWDVLSKHSLYVVVTTQSAHADSEHLARLKDIERGFCVLHDLLVTAPLPGGRTSLNDNAISAPSADGENTDRVWILDDLDVRPGDYLFWEPTLQSSSSGMEHDVPTDFQADAAKRKHQKWQEYVMSVRRSPAFTLTRHVPEVGPLLDILAGQVNISIDPNNNTMCDTWHEALVAELLYRQPDMRPTQLSRRARYVAQQYQSNVTVIEDALLNVMEGNAAVALDLLFEFGASSGAALPSTLMALLCSLFVDSALLDESTSSRKIEFLCDASSAILSSLSNTENHDIGVQLAIRLLLPYALEEGVYGETIRSTIAEVLEHYSPTTDGYTRSMLALVKPLVERKSLQILDATSTVVLASHRQSMDDFNFEAAVWVLLDGIDLEKLVLSHRELGACYRTLAQLCLETADHLLTLPSGDEDDLTRVADAKMVAQAMVNVFGNRVQDIPEALFLSRALQLVIALGQDEYGKASRLVIDLMARDVDPLTGVARLRNIHWSILRYAQRLIDLQQHEHGWKDSSSSAEFHFDSQGMSLLMERYLLLTSLPDSTPKSPAMEQSFAQGLAQSFMAENARKAQVRKEHGNENMAGMTIPKEMNTCNFHTYSLNVQEQFLQHLLDT